MSPSTPDDGGSPSPAYGHPIIVRLTCPRCQHVFAPIALPVKKPPVTDPALKRKLKVDTGPIVPKTPPPGDRRLAETEIIEPNRP